MQEHFVAAGRVDFDISVGPATFVRKHVPVSSAGDVVTYGERNGARYDDWTGMPTNFIYVRIPFRGSRLTVLNFYGTPFPGDKLDTPARLEQSQRIVDFVKKEKGEVILCGDFNLMPQTKSIGMIDAVLRNLITASDIKTTRSTISRYYGTSVQQNFADYTFVSHGITVGTLDVPPDCVASDHLPMILTFD
ncbi:hypothetical protein HYR65_01200 [Candidatus Azambacteria bacterium]|nr:hypothetical protein [Candidatus Azambacteria bacterium]